MDARKWRELLLTYVEDLTGRPLPAIQMACRRWRQNPENRFFPTSGQLIELCTPAFADKPKSYDGRPCSDGTKQPWGGACQCDACMKRTPRENFWHASNADHARDRAEREDWDYWLEQRLGFNPKRHEDGPEIQRTPEEIEALLTKTRAKYPKVFDYEFD